MKMRIVIGLTVLALALCLPFAALAKDGVDEKNKVINLAGYDACTGKYGDYGIGDKRGQEVALEEINAQGGIQAGPLKGYKLALEFFDDRGDPKESANVAKKISGGDYLVALGPTMSSCALAATPVYYRNQTPNIITYSNANTITEQGFDNLVRLTYTTKSISQYMAEQAKEQFKAKTVAVISENQDYGQQLLNSFKAKAKEIGLEITTESVITPGQDVDFKAVLLKAKDKNPDALILFVTYNEGGLLVKQTRELGWDIPIYAPDALTEPKFFALAGPLDNVFLQVSPNVDVERPAAKVLKEQWNKKYEGFPPLAAIYGYDAVKLAAKIIEAGGVDRASFIANMKKVQMEGVANPVYSFDEVGDGKSPNFVTVPAAKYYKDNF